MRIESSGWLTRNEILALKARGCRVINVTYPDGREVRLFIATATGGAR